MRQGALRMPKPFLRPLCVRCNDGGKRIENFFRSCALIKEVEYGTYIGKDILGGLGSAHAFFHVMSGPLPQRIFFPVAERRPSGPSSVFPKDKTGRRNGTKGDGRTASLCPRPRFFRASVRTEEGEAQYRRNFLSSLCDKVIPHSPRKSSVLLQAEGRV